MRGWTRRHALAGLCALPAASALAAPAPEILALERRSGGRLGVHAWQAGRILVEHRPDERFPLCSTFKLLLAARVLDLAEAGREKLDAQVHYGEADLLGVAPTTRANVAAGSLSVRVLCQAAVEQSDNTAANLLLARTGGPQALTAWLRSLGDAVTRLDRNEPDLNDVPVGDPRDSTSPRAMAGVLRRLLTDDVLKPGSRDALTGWLKAAAPGADRLPAALAPGWSIGHKTGTGPHNSVNDVAVMYPPDGRPPVFAAVYLTRAQGETPALEKIHAEIGRIILARAG